MMVDFHDGWEALPAGPGWQVGPALALELDVLLAGLRDAEVGTAMLREFTEMLLSVPAEWRQELHELVGSTRGFFSMFETASFLAGQPVGEDYGLMTIAIRDLTMEAALDRLAEEFRPYGFKPDASLAPRAALIDLWVRGKPGLFRQCGLEMPAGSPALAHLPVEFEQALELLPGSKKFGRFWHWIDRFYYEVYHPWRNTREEQMSLSQRRAQTALGGLSGKGLPPALAWLPAQNPLVLFKNLSSAVEAGRMGVYFWVEPFGLADTWTLYPGCVLAAFSPPDEPFRKFSARADDVALRVKALADPTRLIILRLIRQFGLLNAEIADYLGLARPTVSVHVRILREAGLVSSEQAGREVRNTVNADEVRRLFRDLDSFLDLPGIPEAPVQPPESSRNPRI